MLIQRGRCLHGGIDKNVVSRRSGTQRGGVDRPRSAVVGRGRVHQDWLGNCRKSIRRFYNWINKLVVITSIKTEKMIVRIGNKRKYICNA
jgi:hypothetical protein